MNRNDIRGKWHKTEEKYCPVEKTEEKYYPVEYCEKENLSVLADAFLIEEAKEYDPEAFLAFAMSKCFLRNGYEGAFRGFNQALLNRRMLYAPHILGVGTPWIFRRYRTEAESVAIMHGIGSLWMIYKQAYRFDADFMEELNKTESLLELPVSVFENLPYPCFYLDLEDQDLFPEYVGCFAAVVWEPDSSTPSFATVRIVKGQDGKIIFSPFCLQARKMEELRFEKNGESYYLFMEKMFAEGKNRKTLDSKTMRICLSDIQEPRIREFNMLLLRMILYLGSNHPDILDADAIDEMMLKKRTAKISPSDAHIQEVGVRIGNTIRQERKVRKKGIETGSGQHKSPHYRAAHWHHYWTGKGRKNLTVRWIGPVYVSGRGGELPATIHPIKKGEEH